MKSKDKAIRLLLVDDEEEFRRATVPALTRRGFDVREAANGNEALAAVHQELPDVVVLDLKMPGMEGIGVLQELRRISSKLPVLILTGHGNLDDALSGIRLDIVDFLQKPVDVAVLGDRIRMLLARGETPVLRERTLAELMVPPDRYRKLYADQPVRDAAEALRAALLGDPAAGTEPGLRSVLVYDRDERFLGVVRFGDLIQLVLPEFLDDSPYRTYFTGMFLAQCKLVGGYRVEHLLGELVAVDVKAPLLEGVHLLARHHLINLPVLEGKKLVGILRQRDIVLQIAQHMGVLD
jgi:CheY-like chemotaxis protein